MRKNKFQTIDEYIKTSPEYVQIFLEKIRQSRRKTVPEAVEGIIYGIPTFKMKTGKYLVYFAVWKNHIGFYPISSTANAFKRELSAYKQGKGNVQFPPDKPIPHDLIRKIIIFRVKEENLSL